METNVNLGTKVGIIGAGQLARMLAQAAQRLGLVPVVLARKPDDPAAQVSSEGVLGSWSDPKALRRLFEQTSLVAFENEFVPVTALEQAVEGLPIAVRPSIGAIGVLQDKLLQKQLLERLGIPYARFEPKPESLAARAWCASVLEHHPEGAVFKTARLGYDGKGLLLARSSADLEDAVRFCEAQGEAPVFAEELVPFRRELALVACHSIHGELATYPLVVSEQQSGVCRLVTGPASILGVSKTQEERAQVWVRQIAEALPLHGTFAIELFETARGELLVNELAPRVHNSGHFTQDASDTDQFENHWRAILGLPLGSTSSAPAFAMLNLLGPRGFTASTAALPSPGPHSHLHWYGKQELRPGRKLGHLNGHGENGRDLQAVIEELLACEREWSQKLTGEES